MAEGHRPRPGPTVRPAELPVGARRSARGLAPADLARELAPALTGARLRAVRIVAAEVLVRHAPAQGCGALRAQLGREAAGDRAAFARASGRCAELEK